MSRRTLGIAAATAVGTAVLSNRWISNLAEPSPEYAPITVEDLASFNTFPINSSNEISGGITNIALMADNFNPLMVAQLAEDLDVLGSRYVRLFIDNKFEKPTGRYHFEYTTGLADLLTQISELSEGRIKAILCLDDLFFLLHSENDQPFYGKARLDHHSLNYASQPDDIKRYQEEYFTNPRYTDSYARRVEAISQALYPVRHTIAAFEAANEPEILFDTGDKVGILTEWYDRIFTAIEQADWDLPIITGLANPALINSGELVHHHFVQSAHIYKGIWSPEQRGLDSYIEAMTNDPSLPPVVLSECGFPRGILGLKMPEELHDRVLSRVLESLFLHNTRIDRRKNTAYIGIAAFGPWQLKTNKRSEDGFHFNTKKYPLTVAKLRAINSLITFN